MQAKNQNKTVPTKVSVNSFLELESFSAAEIKSAKTLIKIFEKVTKKKCIMWGKIFGFGTYHYIGKSRQGDWMAAGFALRKNAITLYIMSGVKSYPTILKDLGEFKVSDGSCLYVKKLEDIDLVVLEKLIKLSFLDLQKKWEVV